MDRLDRWFVEVIGRRRMETRATPRAQRTPHRLLTELSLMEHGHETALLRTPQQKPFTARVPHF